ncbi:hypothetical protein JNUCC0626_37410 [Lentzea sp. JNUCC 0626]
MCFDSTDVVYGWKELENRAAYLIDVEKHAVWIDYAGAHPKATE